MENEKLATSKTIRSILFPLASAEDDRAALVHALRIAISNRSLLSILRLDSNWDLLRTKPISDIRQLMTLWGMPPSLFSAKDEIQNTESTSGFTILQCLPTENSESPSWITVNAEHKAVDLVVMNADFGDSLTSYLQGRIELYGHLRIHATLLVPSNTIRFVSTSDGSVRLSKILVPFLANPDPISGLTFVRELLASLEQPQGSFTLLYVGTPDATPSVEPPQVDGWTWVVKSLPGSPAEKILQQADCMDADLIVLTVTRTEGLQPNRLGPIPVQVIRRSRCPILLVPVDYG